MKAIATFIFVCVSLAMHGQITTYGEVTVTPPVVEVIYRDTVIAKAQYTFSVYETVPCTIITAMEVIDCYCLFKSTAFETKDGYKIDVREFVNAVTKEEFVLNINFESIQSIYLR